jgi:hypothetical protein
LRLSLNLEMLWWCGGSSEQAGFADGPPTRISERAFAAAGLLVADYFVPMAERIYGDASATRADRNAATMARWIVRDRPEEVHVRHVQREVRLPGLKAADDIHEAADTLIEADWLRSPAQQVSGPGRPRAAYSINPRLWRLA